MSKWHSVIVNMFDLISNKKKLTLYWIVKPQPYKDTNVMRKIIGGVCFGSRVTRKRVVLKRLGAIFCIVIDGLKGSFSCICVSYILGNVPKIKKGLN